MCSARWVKGFNEYFSVYVQDDWRITSKLTLNLGLPNTTFGNRNFGRITSQQNDPRQGQVALRLMLRGQAQSCPRSAVALE